MRPGNAPPGLRRTSVPVMRTLHVGLRVSELERSLAFYRAVGYTVIGTVGGTPFGGLTMLQLPGDTFVTIELVHDPAKGTVDPGTGIHHLVIQVDSLDATLADLAVKGIVADPPAGTGRADGPQTSWITDPDGYRIDCSSGRPATPRASPRPTAQSIARRPSRRPVSTRPASSKPLGSGTIIRSTRWAGC
jgi:catechol 2,3-dioxygenase-like lactoylglutathione lyase family enzyme